MAAAPFGRAGRRLPSTPAATFTLPPLTAASTRTRRNNHGDTLLKLQLNNGSFQILDWFTPFNAACVDEADLELGSGGTALLPTDFTGGRNFAAIYNKEGRLSFSTPLISGISIPPAIRKFRKNSWWERTPVLRHTGSGEAEGTGWNRLYGNPSYWNGIFMRSIQCAVEAVPVSK